MLSFAALCAWQAIVAVGDVRVWDGVQSVDESHDNLMLLQTSSSMLRSVGHEEKGHKHKKKIEKTYKKKSTHKEHATSKKHHEPTPKTTKSKKVEKSVKHKKTKEEVKSVGSEAELSKEGYERVAAEKSNSEMELFMNRVAVDLNLTISTKKSAKPAIAGFLPYYSGVKAVRNFGQLKAELQKLSRSKGSWVSPRGSSATLDEAGFLAVSKLHNSAELADFVTRLAQEKLDSSITDQKQLQSFAKSFGKKKSDFKKLKEDLLALTKAKKSWLQREHPWITLMAN